MGPEPTDPAAAVLRVDWCRLPMSEPCPCIKDPRTGYKPCLYHKQNAKLEKRASWKPSGPDPEVAVPPEVLADGLPAADPDDGASDSSNEVHNSSVLIAFAKKFLSAAEEQVHAHKCVREVYGVPDPEPEPEAPEFPRMTKSYHKFLRATAPEDSCMPIWNVAYVTQTIPKGQRDKWPYNQHDWVGSMADECHKVFGKYEVLAEPVPWHMLPDDASLAHMLPVTAIKGADLTFIDQLAKTRIVYGGHLITDKWGKVIDKRDHPTPPGLTRLGTTSPFEVRAALAWAMIADTVSFPQKSPTLVSFDVTSAYLQSTFNNENYYVTTRDPLLLEAIKKEKGWTWDFKGDPWFKLERAMYGHPFAGDFWGWEFRSNVEAIGWRTFESDDEKTIYVHRGFGPNAHIEGPEQDPILATMVIYVDDGFLVSFDGEITKKTQELLNDQWSARDWNVWERAKTERFLAGDHRYMHGESRSIVTVGMKSYKEHGVERYIEDGGKLLPTVPRTPMSTAEESADDSLYTPYAEDAPVAEEAPSLPPTVTAQEVQHLRNRTSVDTEYKWLLREAADAWAAELDDEALAFYASGGQPRVMDALDGIARGLLARDDGELPYAVGSDKAARHVGIWSYAAQNSVPEISHTVQWLARRTTKWTPECEQRLRRLVTYLKGRATDVLCLVGYRGDKVTLVCEEDADFAGDASRRSTTGYIIKLVGEKGSHVLLSWKSQLQKSISLSTAEAEIVAFRDALKAVVGMLEFIQLFFGASIPVSIGCDSSACLGIVAKGFSKALKHIRKLQDVSTKWVAETLNSLMIEAKKVNSEDNGSDLFTKALDVSDTIQHTRFGLGIVNESHCAHPFLERECNGRPCRVFTSEFSQFGSVPCFCNGGRPRKREFKKDYIYTATNPLTGDHQAPPGIVFQNSDFSCAADFGGVFAGSSVVAQRSISAMLTKLLSQ